MKLPNKTPSGFGEHFSVAHSFFFGSADSEAINREDNILKQKKKGNYSKGSPLVFIFTPRVNK